MTRRFRFSLSTVFWLMLSAAMFLAGRYSLTNQLKTEREAARQSQMMGELAHAHAKIVSEKIERQLNSTISPFISDVLSDGDVKLEIDGEQMTVRVPGIVLPDVSHPLSEACQSFVSAFCLEQRVHVVGDQKDRYGRLLADVIVDGKSLREELLKAGIARLTDERRATHDRLASLEEEARASHRGIWSAK